MNALFHCHSRGKGAPAARSLSGNPADEPRRSRALLLVVALLFAAPLHAEVLVVTLLGTGAPAPETERFGPAVVVEAGHQKLLFDAGRGVAQRIYETGFPFPEMNKVFITHLHYDHIVGLADLMMSGWVFQRDRPLEVWGPVGVKAHLEHLTRAYDADIRARLDYTKLSPDGIRHIARPVREGIVYERDGATVTAFRVDHGAFPAWGYRVDYDTDQGKDDDAVSVVISGDTRYSKNLVRHARGTDLLIHEVAHVSDALIARNPRLAKVLAVHASPGDVAKVLAEARPRLAVLVHPVVFGMTHKEVVEAASRGHNVEVIIGRDRMAFDVGDQFRRWRR